MRGDESDVGFWFLLNICFEVYHYWILTPRVLVRDHYLLLQLRTAWYFSIQSSECVTSCPF